MISAIYYIYNTKSQKMYIGSSKDVIKRLNCHQRHLRQNNHDNKYLQNSWNVYKEDNFTFAILERTKSKNLIEREQFWIDYYNSHNDKFGYNICPKAGSPFAGRKHSIRSKKLMSFKAKGQTHFLGCKHSEEAKKKMVLSWKTKRRKGKREGCFHSEETKKKISKGNMGKIPWNKNLKNTQSIEQRKASSLRLKGKKRSKETKGKISEGLKKCIRERLKKGLFHWNKNKVSPMKGKHHSDKAKEVLSKKLMGRTPWNKNLKYSLN